MRRPGENSPARQPRNQSKSATPAPKQSAAVHPYRAAIIGVMTGARMPPPFPPVLSNPQAAPDRSPVASIVTAQKIASHAIRNAYDKASAIAVINGADAGRADCAEHHTETDARDRDHYAVPSPIRTGWKAGLKSSPPPGRRPRPRSTLRSHTSRCHSIRSAVSRDSSRTPTIREDS